MSYEGYYQFICKDGHYTTEDCYMMEPEDFKCSYIGKDFHGRTGACSAPLAWWNSVNTTNGSFEPDERPGFEGREIRIDGYVELTPIKTETCDKCHSVLDQRYIPPQGYGHLVTI